MHLRIRIPSMAENESAVQEMEDERERGGGGEEQETTVQDAGGAVGEDRGADEVENLTNGG